jgi:hypothetical protein
MIFYYRWEAAPFYIHNIPTLSPQPLARSNQDKVTLRRLACSTQGAQSGSTPVVARSVMKDSLRAFGIMSDKLGRKFGMQTIQVHHDEKTNTLNSNSG